MRKNKVKWIILSAVMASLVLIVCLIVVKYSEIRKDRYYENFISLYEVQCETCINIVKDPDFINTATADQHMVVPEAYYTDRISAVKGDGTLCVYLTIDGDVIAYFGDHGIEHYDLGFLPRPTVPNIN